MSVFLHNRSYLPLLSLSPIAGKLFVNSADLIQVLFVLANDLIFELTEIFLDLVFINLREGLIVL
jgi:hypothetical protein